MNKSSFTVTTDEWVLPILWKFSKELYLSSTFSFDRNRVTITSPSPLPTFMEDGISYIRVTDFPEGRIYDWEYLFPCVSLQLGDQIFLSSSILSSTELHRIVHMDDFPVQFLELDEKDGALATHLLAESLSYRTPIMWLRNTLYICGCGYIQIQEMTNHFLALLNDISRKRMRYIPGVYKNYKALYVEGEFWTAVPEKDETPLPTDKKETPVEGIIRLERKDDYFEFLGYKADSVDQEWDCQIRVSHVTYQIGEGPQEATNYFYTTSSGAYTDLSITSQPWNAEKEKYYQEHCKNFLTDRMKNLMKNYPGFIPSDLVKVEMPTSN